VKISRKKDIASFPDDQEPVFAVVELTEDPLQLFYVLRGTKKGGPGMHTEGVVPGQRVVIVDRKHVKRVIRKA